MRVLELMHTHVVTVQPEDTLRDAVDKMDLYQVSGLPVVDDEGHLVGVITEHDIIRELLPQPDKATTEESYRTEWQDLPTRAARVRGMQVKQAMTSNVIAVDENTDVLEAAAIMLQKKVKRLPVTAEGKLVGIISRIDICQAVLEDRL
ncbi:MAG: CBS domain-containing protein [Firmicutes bacterium]|nr:CBS domain-containing protein [Bacillota bacterium]